MNLRFLLVVLITTLCCCGAGVLGWSDEPGPDGEPPWPMEQLHREGSRVLRGLILRTRKDEIEFIEVVRPPGQPMYLVVHHCDRQQVDKLVRLDNDQRKRLYDHIVDLLAVRSRVRIEKLRMEDILLRQIVRDDRLRWQFESRWFTLESTADESSTRRCVVRIASTFSALRHLLPPRRAPKTPPRLVIYGTMDQYQSQFETAHPAFYQRRSNSIYAASEMTRFATRLAQLRKQTSRRREQYQQLNRDMPGRLAVLSKRLKQTGHSDQAIQLELRARSAAWQREYDSKVGQLNQVDRRNEALFWEVSHEMFQRLKHEALHAYLENYVFPHDRHDVPHWLNEGLAQLFEHAQIDDDQFRLDAPPQQLLRRLQSELASDQPLKLSELLRADGRQFWSAHDQSGESNRFYLYAWGLTHYLVFHHHLLSGDKLADYVTPGSVNLLPEHRLTALTDQSFEATERQWRRYIEQLRVGDVSLKR